MPLSVVFIMSALVFYTVSIWSEKLKKVIKPWMVLMMGVGFACDMVGTTMMFLRSTTHHINGHTLCGYTALLIMLIHFIWAVMAVENFGKAQQWFNRFSVYAWCLWLVAFVSGIPKASM
ncbi:MAG: HsmA family protein [Candidatus Komeilibacteria bacterium]